MAIIEGTHTQGGGGPPIDYRVEYEVHGSVVHYTATFGTVSANSTHEGQFDFDPAKIDAAEAVDAFMQNHIAKADFDVAP